MESGIKQDLKLDINISVVINETVTSIFFSLKISLKVSVKKNIKTQTYERENACLWVSTQTAENYPLPACRLSETANCSYS